MGCCAAICCLRGKNHAASDQRGPNPVMEAGGEPVETTPNSEGEGADDEDEGIVLGTEDTDTDTNLEKTKYDETEGTQENGDGELRDGDSIIMGDNEYICRISRESVEYILKEDTNFEQNQLANETETDTHLTSTDQVQRNKSTNKTNSKHNQPSSGQPSKVKPPQKYKYKPVLIKIRTYREYLAYTRKMNRKAEKERKAREAWRRTIESKHKVHPQPDSPPREVTARPATTPGRPVTTPHQEKRYSSNWDLAILSVSRHQSAKEATPPPPQAVTPRVYSCLFDGLFDGQEGGDDSNVKHNSAQGSKENKGSAFIRRGKTAKIAASLLTRTANSRNSNMHNDQLITKSVPNINMASGQNNGSEKAKENWRRSATRKEPMLISRQSRLNRRKSDSYIGCLRNTITPPVHTKPLESVNGNIPRKGTTYNGVEHPSGYCSRQSTAKSRRLLTDSPYAQPLPRQKIYTPDGEVITPFRRQAPSAKPHEILKSKSGMKPKSGVKHQSKQDNISTVHVNSVDAGKGSDVDVDKMGDTGFATDVEDTKSNADEGVDLRDDNISGDTPVDGMPHADDGKDPTLPQIVQPEDSGTVDTGVRTTNAEPPPGPPVPYYMKQRRKSCVDKESSDSPAADTGGECNIGTSDTLDAEKPPDGCISHYGDDIASIMQSEHSELSVGKQSVQSSLSTDTGPPDIYEFGIYEKDNRDIYSLNEPGDGDISSKDCANEKDAEDLGLQGSRKEDETCESKREASDMSRDSIKPWGSHPGDGPDAKDNGAAAPGPPSDRAMETKGSDRKSKDEQNVKKLMGDNADQNVCKESRLDDDKPSATGDGVGTDNQMSSSEGFVENHKKNGAPQRRATKSARQTGTTKSKNERAKTAGASSRPSRPSKSRNTPRSQSARDGKRKEFFKEELKRLQTALLEEKDKIHAPPVKEYVPYTFNTLEPYYNCHTAKFLINIDEQQEEEAKPAAAPTGEPSYVSRKTALGMCDPWVAHQMDLEVDPKPDGKPVSTPRDTKKNKSGEKEKERPPKEGSTRLPKFPAVAMSRDGISRDLKYSDVPKLRETLKAKMGSGADEKLNDDYNRTKQDFYRMELDRMKEYHPINRPHMRATYFAYLQNTPGAKKAVYECVKTTEKAS